MSERDVNARRNWKAQTFPYDHFIPDESRECTYCLTDLQAEILRGIIEPLGWTTRWWSDTDTPIERDVIEAFRDDLIRRLMMSCCGDEVPVQYRYTSDGVLQRSTDGGATWTDAPEYDPRVYSPQFPPVAGDDIDDKKCVAATGAAVLVKEQVGDQLTDGMSRYTLSQLITDWVKTMIESSNPFQALLTTIANQIFALVIAVLRPALTDDVYDLFKCALYCHMADDVSFNDDQWQAVRSDITSNISGIAGIFLEHLVYLLGTGGLTNLARAGGATTGDCSDCCPDCSVNWIAIPDAGIGLLVGRGDGYVDIEAQLTGGRYYATAYTGDKDICCKWDGYEILSGVIDDTAQLWKTCGSTDASTGPLFGDHCLWTVQFDSGTPFTIRMKFVEC